MGGWGVFLGLFSQDFSPKNKKCSEWPEMQRKHIKKILYTMSNLAPVPQCWYRCHHACTGAVKRASNACMDPRGQWFFIFFNFTSSPPIFLIIWMKKNDMQNFFEKNWCLTPAIGHWKLENQPKMGKSGISLAYKEAFL